MNTGTVPQHLVVQARTGFLTALADVEMPWQRIAATLPMDARSIDLVDLGAPPMPVQSKGGPQIQDFIEKTLTVKPIDWEIVVFISHNAVADDQTGQLLNKVRGAGENFQLHLNNRVFQTLNAGDGSTYGACYDGSDFFDDDHIDKGAQYQTGQDNEFGLALSLDNFNTVNVAAQRYLNDQGEESGYTPDTLIVPPELDYTASQIVGNPEAYDTANRKINPFAGKFSKIVSPKLDSTAWFLLDTKRTAKPLIVVMRQQPQLQGTWEDLTAADGGRYYFKFFARYNVYYGDWRLATMGNT